MQKLATTFPRSSVFLLSGDHAGLDEVDDRVGEHLRVNPEILLFLQELQHRLGDPADSQFQGTPVLHQRRDEFADLPRDLVRLGRLELDHRRVGRDQDVQIVHTEETVAEGARHLRVDLRDDEAGVLGRALDDVDRDAQAAHARARRAASPGSAPHRAAARRR